MVSVLPATLSYPLARSRPLSPALALSLSTTPTTDRFLRFCRAQGLEEDDLFSITDLTEGGGSRRVVNCLIRLEEVLLYGNRESRRALTAHKKPRGGAAHRLALRSGSATDMKPRYGGQQQSMMSPAVKVHSAGNVLPHTQTHTHTHTPAIAT